jgi:natural product precursor
MKKTTNFDAFAQFADARLSKEEMKMIKGGTNPEDSGFEGGNPGTGGGGTGGGNVSQRCVITGSYRNDGQTGANKFTIFARLEDGSIISWNSYHSEVVGGGCGF